MLLSRNNLFNFRAKFAFVNKRISARSENSTDWKFYVDVLRECVAECLRRLTRNSKVRTAVGSNPTLDSLVAVRYTSPGRPEPCEGNLVAVAGSCAGVMVKHPWPLLEISLSDFRGLATLNINTYLPTLHGRLCHLSFVEAHRSSMYSHQEVFSRLFCELRLFLCFAFCHKTSR